MTAEAWPSTKGLSVYNALSHGLRDMTDEEILSYLRTAWDPQLERAYVHDGIAFLVQREFVRVDGPTVRLKERGPNGKGKMVVRANEDTDLRMTEHWSP